jgi:NitT/TauT family transport system substrate-binding protein
MRNKLYSCLELNWKRIKLFGIIVWIVLLQGYSGMGQPNKIRFAPQWTAQAQFAGYYVALEKGYYTEAGIDVEIIYPNAGKSVLNLLESGEADIVSLFLTTGIKSKCNGVDLVNVGQISQHPATMIVARKSDNIFHLSDLNHEKIAVWKSGFDELPRWLIAKNNLDVEWVPVLSSVNLFLAGGVKAMAVMWYNEYNQILNSGVDESELSCFFLSDFGLDIPEDGLYCLDHTRKEKGELIAKFLQATLRGWEYARSNQDYTVDLVIGKMKQAHISANRTHQKWMLEKTLELIKLGTKKVSPGELCKDDYLITADLLYQQGFISVKIPYEDFFQPVKNPLP